MKITILGSGSAYGLPMIFNTWGKANPNNPKNYRTRASIFIEDKGKSILIDAGPELRIQANENNIKNIDAVFITHGHYDHIAGIPELPRATKILGHGIDIYASALTMNELKRSYGYLFDEKAEAEPESKSIQWKILPDKGKFSASQLEFETMQFPHHSIFSSAFRYKNFAYLTDWADFAPQWEDFLKDLDVLVVECNNGREYDDNGHSDLSKIIEIKQKVAPKKIILSHLSRRIDDEAFSKLLPPDCELSYDGMSFEIK